VIEQGIKVEFFLKVGRYRFQENVFGFRVASFEEIFPVRLQETGPVKSAPLVFYEEFNGLKILETISLGESYTKKSWMSVGVCMIVL